MRLCVLGLIVVGLTACSHRESEPARFAVVRDSLGGPAGASGRRVFLNEEIRVYFSGQIDPLTITPDTVRLRDLEDGRIVGCKIAVATRSISLAPAPPCRAELDDGALKLDRSYRIEVSGFPSTNAVRSVGGQLLERGYARELRTVRADQQPSPLLPVGIGDPRYERFALQIREPIAADVGTLRLHFNVPPLPSSVTPRAFHLHGAQGDKFAELPIVASARVLPQAELGASLAGLLEGGAFPGSVVELTLSERLQPKRLLYLELDHGPHGLVDYAGRPVHDLRENGQDCQYVQLLVKPGDRAHVFQLEFLAPEVLPPAREGVLGFAIGTRWAKPACGREIGSGKLGRLEPKQNVVLERGKPFDRGDGTLVRCDDDSFEFTQITIPAGVQVRVASPGQVQVRSLGDVVIDGTLVLDGTLRALARYSSGAKVSAADLVDSSGFVLIAGSDVTIRGGVRREGIDSAGSPLSIVCGGRLRQSGRMPEGAILAAELAPPEVESQEALIVSAPLGRGVPPGQHLVAESWTAWHRLEDQGRYRADEVRIDGRNGPLEVACQIVPAHPSDPSRPAADEALLPQPIELPPRGPLTWEPGSFVRFLLRAKLEPDAPLPSLRGIVFLAR